MRLGVGFITCKRFSYLETTIDSIYFFNPSLKKLPLIIADDNSPDEDVEKMRELWPHATIVHSEKRVGYPTNVKNLISTAEEEGLDLLYWSTNDIVCVRKVDFKPLVKLFKTHEDTGQVQFMHWKGKYGELNRERARKNWTTHNQIRQERPIYAGDETLIPANWSWTAHSQIQRLNVGDFVGSAVNKNIKIEKRMVEAEKIMMNNWYNNGLKNYECQDQPFMNQDWAGTNNTGYEDV